MERRFQERWSRIYDYGRPMTPPEGLWAAEYKVRTDM